VPRCFSRSSLTRALTSLPAVLTSGLCYPAGSPAAEDRSSSASARALISDLMTNTWCSYSAEHLQANWNLLRREEEGDKLTVSSQGHRAGQSSPACSPDVHYGGGTKPCISAWRRLALAAPPPCKGVDRAQDRRIPLTPNCGFKDFPGHLLGMGKTPTFPHKWTGFIS